jgi:arylsulfatase A-like enzyme
MPHAPTLRVHLAALAAALLLGRPAPAAMKLGPPPAKPNVVFILADDLGHGHLGCYGQKLIRTPHLDRLAAQGLRFTQAYAGCSVCAPSRSVLMTGLHMGHTSVRANSGGVPLRATDVTVAALLQKAGYATGCFGKWGLGDAGTEGEPTRHGFDEFFGYLHQVHAHSHYPSYLWHNGKKVSLAGNDGNERGLTGARRARYASDEVTARALAFLRRNKDRPFFCYIPYTLPHVEVLAPEASVKPYRGKFKEVPFVDPRKHYADQPQTRAVFAGMVSHLDACVGQIVKQVDDLGLGGRTLVVFSSDNGAQAGYGADPDFFQATGGLRGHKVSLYEGGIRVPLLARWTGKVKPGLSDHVCYFPDVLPTLAELAAVKVPAGVDGLSLLPTLLGAEVAGRKQERHAFLYWELQGYNAKEKKFVPKALAQAVRLGDWKAVRPRTGAALELYDLGKDVGETRDVAAKHPAVVARVEAILRTARTEPRPQAEPDKPKGRLFR